MSNDNEQFPPVEVTFVGFSESKSAKQNKMRKSMKYNFFELLTVPGPIFPSQTYILGRDDFIFFSK